MTPTTPTAALKLARDDLQSPISRGPTWALIERYADAVCEYNTAVRIDVGIDKAGAECLSAEKELRAHLAALAAIDALPAPSGDQRQAGARAWAEAIADPDMSPADKVAHVYRAMLGALPAQAAPAPQAGAPSEEPAEPVAWLVRGGRAFVDRPFASKRAAEDSAAQRDDGAEVVPLYAAPQPAPAAAAPVQPLTDDRLDELRRADTGALNFVTLRQFRAVARSVERAHGITATTAKG